MSKPAFVVLLNATVVSLAAVEPEMRRWFYFGNPLDSFLHVRLILDESLVSKIRQTEALKLAKLTKPGVFPPNMDLS